MCHARVGIAASRGYTPEDAPEAGGVGDARAGGVGDAWAGGVGGAENFLICGLIR